MSNNQAVSPLQMLDWRIAEFTASNNVVTPANEIPHTWKIKAHIDSLEPVNNQLRAAVVVNFLFLAEQDNARIRFEGVAASYFVFDKEKASVDDPQALFDQLLRVSAMTNMLGNLRVFLLQTGALFQTGAKRVILPFINLNDFHFDEEYTFTV